MSYSIENSMVAVDDFCDYVPIVSTVSNLIDLFQKCIVLPLMKQENIAQSRYYTHLQQKSFSRCVILLIPVLGNIIIGVTMLATVCQDRQVHDHSSSETKRLSPEGVSGTSVPEDEQISPESVSGTPVPEDKQISPESVSGTSVPEDEQVSPEGVLGTPVPEDEQVSPEGVLGTSVPEDEQVSPEGVSGKPVPEDEQISPAGVSGTSVPEDEQVSPECVLGTPVPEDKQVSPEGVSGTPVPEDEQISPEGVSGTPVPEDEQVSPEGVSGTSVPEDEQVSPEGVSGTSVPEDEQVSPEGVSGTSVPEDEQISPAGVSGTSVPEDEQVSPECVLGTPVPEDEQVSPAGVSGISSSESKELSLVERLEKKQQKMTKLLQEFFKSEHQFRLRVKFLRDLLNSFNFKQKKTRFLRTQIQHLNVLIRFQDTLLANYERTKKTPQIEQFIKIFNMETVFVYKKFLLEFMEKYKMVVSCLARKELNHNKKYNRIIKKLKKKHKILTTDNFIFDNYSYCAPLVQRAPRILLFIEDMIKASDEGNPTHTSLILLQKCFSTALEKINSKLKKRSENGSTLS